MTCLCFPMLLLWPAPRSPKVSPVTKTHPHLKLVRVGPLCRPRPPTVPGTSLSPQQNGRRHVALCGRRAMWSLRWMGGGHMLPDVHQFRFPCAGPPMLRHPDVDCICELCAGTDPRVLPSSCGAWRLFSVRWAWCLPSVPKRREPDGRGDLGFHVQSRSGVCQNGNQTKKTRVAPRATGLRLLIVDGVGAAARRATKRHTVTCI